MATKMVWMLLALFIFEYAGADLQCINEDGKPVDWYVLYKLPTMTKSKDYLLRKGLAYMFITSDNPEANWKLSSISINDSKSMIGRTLDPLYNGNSENMLTVLYNDEPPSISAGSIYGHTKGVVLANEKEGLWIIHSVPKFPLEPISPKTKAKNRYQYARNAVRYGQSCLCISVASDQLNNLGTQLMYNKPKIYSSSIPDSIAEQYKNLTEVVKNKKSIKTAPWTSKVLLRSRKGKEFISYAKGSGFGKDLYAGWIAPDIGSELKVETWANGPGELPSDCKSKYHVMDVTEFAVKVGEEAISFKNTNDHSKWAISDNATKMVCIGDINRMEAQLKRGGGTVCFNSLSLWGQFNQAIRNVQPCPKSLCGQLVGLISFFMGQGLGIFETLSGRPQIMDDPQLTGFKKYFNNQTLYGRANVSRATLGLSLIGVIYYKLFHSKKSIDVKKS